MALKTIVKISNVTNLSDARYCAGMGVEMIGFSLDENSEDYVDATKFAGITGWLAGVKLVGEISGQPEIDLSAYPIDSLQINTPTLFDFFAEVEVPVLLSIQVRDLAHLEGSAKVMEEYKNRVAYFVLESENLGIDELTAPILRRLCAKYPVLIGFGLSRDNVNAVLDRIGPAGIALKGGKEIKPGLKDFDELAEVLEEIEVE